MNKTSILKLTDQTNVINSTNQCNQIYRVMPLAIAEKQGWFLVCVLVLVKAVVQNSNLCTVVTQSQDMMSNADYKLFVMHIQKTHNFCIISQIYFLPQFHMKIPANDPT